FRLQRILLASNFSPDLVPLLRSLGDAPGSRQPPLGVGISLAGPICPVMISCCLSTGSFRFLILPVPTEDFYIPYGLLTGSLDLLTRPHWGFHVPHGGDSTGEDAFCTAGTGCLLPAMELFTGTIVPFIIVAAVSMTWCNAASSKVHLYSSFQFSP